MTGSGTGGPFSSAILPTSHLFAQLKWGRTSQLNAEFTKRGVKPIGLSTDTVEEHLKWIEDVNDTQNTTLRFPIVADADLKIAKLYEMIHPSQSETAAVRSVFIIDSDKNYA
jgi:alkyl hydroperoxide reductase subunit AhpC